MTFVTSYLNCLCYFKWDLFKKPFHLKFFFTDIRKENWFYVINVISSNYANLLFLWLYKFIQTFYTSHCITCELWLLCFFPSKLLNFKKAESWSYKILSPASREGSPNICPAEFHQLWTSQLLCVFHTLPSKRELLVQVSVPTLPSIRWRWGRR